MRPSSTLSAALLMFAAVTAPAAAQNGGEAGPDGASGDFVQNVIGALAPPNWNVYMNGGFATHGRYMLQRVSTPASGERTLRSENAFTIGVGAGVDFLLRSAVRMSYVFSESHLEFRTDDGDGSERFDIEELGLLQRHAAAIEIVRYMLPARTLVTPYGSAGLAGAWWVLDESSSLVTSDGGSSQFRLGAMATFGLQVQLTPQSSARLEVATSSIRSPFTGSNSFRANGAATIDEPTRVGQTDFRFAAVYYFSVPHRPRQPAPVAER